ncbi:peptidyl-prolyl cis-trans isomerase [Desulfocurvus sp.]|uniref:peptidyl-prolyl cis-trans isomerase n=1 Tax=Desulfocurvus sp. TaxID=2871698 RepID=UPI0025BDA3AE|nr:peptidyl-prolyl cis-trans isomerase [Desulfocurvus sp.]MCK9239817.1 SurA N-terminal domain-containing protein [Desulfocurvus sp.]
MKPILRLALVVGLLLAAVPARAEVVDRIVAVVNGQAVTLFELNQHMRPLLDRFRGRELTMQEKAAIAKMRTDLLQKIIDDMLITQQVEKLGLSATEVEVQNSVERFYKQNGMTAEDFDKQLLLEGMTREEFAQKVRQDILKHRLLGFMVRRKVVVSDEEVKAYYEKHIESFRKDKEVALSVILLPLAEDADALRGRIAGGELAFADAADLYSRGPGVGQGGSLGRLAWVDLAQDWRDSLEGVAPGGMTRPFDFRGHTAILRLDDLREGETRPLEEVKEEIRDRLFGIQAEARFSEYMQTLRDEAVIEMKL